MKIEIIDMTLSHLATISNTLTTEFDNFWSFELLKSELLNTNSHYLIAKSNNEIVGFGGIWFGYEEVHITNIVTRIDKRNQGIASKLLENLISIAKTIPKCILLTLEVRESNLPAINLYEKFNFKKVGIRRNYYNGIENAIIMTKNII